MPLNDFVNVFRLPYNSTRLRGHCMAWVPTLTDRRGPLYVRIADALSADILVGRLRRGEQLPTHRALAKALKVDLSTVTHAYREARSRGLIVSRVGQGTFVTESLSQGRPAKTTWATFDLSMVLPPQPLEADLEGRITRGIAAMARDPGLSGYLSYCEPGGLPHEREAAAQWLATRIPSATASRLLICPGTQSILCALLASLTERGDVILTERLTYPGMKAAAWYSGVKLVGIFADHSGADPDALKDAIVRYRPKAVYLTPTIQNPTTATMPPARKRAVAAVLRDHGVPLIEDDTYGRLEPESVPIATLLPELTYYAGSISKCIAPGLRVSFFLAPNEQDCVKFAARQRAAFQMPTLLSVGLVTRWLRDGSADAIIEAIRSEAAARQKLGAKILAGRDYSANPNGHHIWLRLPEHWPSCEVFVNHARQRGLAIMGSEAFATGPERPSAVRLALGARSGRYELAAALKLMVTILDSKPRS